MNVANGLTDENDADYEEDYGCKGYDLPNGLGRANWLEPVIVLVVVVVVVLVR